MFSYIFVHLLEIVFFIGVVLGGEIANSDDGVQYVFSIPRLINTNHLPALMITTNSRDTVDVTVSIPNQEDIHKTLTRRVGAYIPLPVDVKIEAGVGKSNQTILVKTPGQVSVYAINREYGASDVLQAIPTSYIGENYFIASYQPNGIYRSCACISALHSSTSIRISTPFGHVTNINLDQYESYRHDAGFKVDASGTVITSDKPISVTSGSVARIPSGECCHSEIMTQLPHTGAWGSMYHIFPFRSLNSSFVYRVFANNNYTALQMSNGIVIHIEPGDFYEGDVAGDTAVSFVSDYDVLVAQYRNANPPRRGDPSMFIVPPVASYTSNVTFPVFSYEYEHDYYINVVTNCHDVEDLLLDDIISVTSWDKLTTDDQSVCCVRHNISTGYHTITHPDPDVTFFVTVYAISVGSFSSSYAYTATQYAQASVPVSTSEMTTISSKTSLPEASVPVSTSEMTTISSKTSLPEALAPLSLNCNPPEINQVAPAGESNVPVHYQAVVTGGTPVYTITYTQDPGSLFDVGSTTVVTAIVLDAAGKLATCSFKIYINAETEPESTMASQITKRSSTIEAPAPLSLNCNPPEINQVAPVGETSVPVHYQAVATGGTPIYTITYTQDPGSLFEFGTSTVVTAIVSDASGKLATCNFRINIIAETDSNTDTQLNNRYSDAVIISGIVVGGVVVMVALIVVILKRKRQSNDNTSQHPATTLPLSSTASDPAGRQRPQETNFYAPGNVNDGYERTLYNRGYRDLDPSAVSQSQYQGQYDQIPSDT